MFLGTNTNKSHQTIPYNRKKQPPHRCVPAEITLPLHRNNTIYFMAGIYLHIPFCKRRCIYCDFFSTTQADKCRRSNGHPTSDGRLHNHNAKRPGSDITLNRTFFHHFSNCVGQRFARAFPHAYFSAAAATLIQ